MYISPFIDKDRPPSLPIIKLIAEEHISYGPIYVKLHIHLFIFKMSYYIAQCGAYK